MKRSFAMATLGRFLLVLVGLLVPVLLVEAGTRCLIAHPGLTRHLPSFLVRFARDCYIVLERPLPQWQAESSRYDAQLTYTLRPGRFVFRTREFATEYRVNALGVRDDEESLQAPEVVVLGDSHAMGWGVEQNETFAQLLEQSTGKRVLNAAVSSYGTVREMRLLDRIDVSRMRYLIVQYCGNDLAENEQFLRDGNIDIMDETAYRAHLSPPTAGQYRWGMYSRYLLSHWLTTEAHASLPGMDEAEAFVHALVTAGQQRLDGVQLVVVLFAHHDVCQAVVQHVRNTPSLPTWVRDLRTICANDLMRDEYSFVLDDHWNAQGHQALATAILEAMPLR